MILKLAFLSQVVERSRKYGIGLGKYYPKDFSSSKLEVEIDRFLAD